MDNIKKLNLNRTGSNIDNVEAEELQRNDVVYDEVFDNDEIVKIDPKKLKFFKNHKYPLYEGNDLEMFIEDIKLNGIITPLHVRSIEDGFYETFIGNNRLNVALILGLEEVPCIVRDDLTDKQVKAFHDSTNLYQRGFERLKPSDKINVIQDIYSSDENPDDSKVKKAKELSLSDTTIKMFKKMASLDSGLVDLMDDEKLSIKSGYYLSFLTAEKQTIVLSFLNLGNKLDIKKAKMLKEEKNLDYGRIEEIIVGTKAKNKGYSINKSLIDKYFDGKSKKEVNEVIEKALQLYFEGEQYEHQES